MEAIKKKIYILVMYPFGLDPRDIMMKWQGMFDDVGIQHTYVPYAFGPMAERPVEKILITEHYLGDQDGFSVGKAGPYIQPAVNDFAVPSFNGLKVAVIGESRVGKTTLIKAMSSFFEWTYADIDPFDNVSEMIPGREFDLDSGVKAHLADMKGTVEIVMAVQGLIHREAFSRYHDTFKVKPELPGSKIDLDKDQVHCVGERNILTGIDVLRDAGLITTSQASILRVSACRKRDVPQSSVTLQLVKVAREGNLIREVGVYVDGMTSVAFKISSEPATE